MKLIVGLGNPEAQYAWTRHNIGKGVVNELGKHFSIRNRADWKNRPKFKSEILEIHMPEKEEPIWIVKPTPHMNESGLSVSALVNFYEVNPNDLLVVYDELDLEVGEYKLMEGKGSRIHNGIQSIKKGLPARFENLWQLRVGVRDPKISGSVQKSGRDPAKYVLGKFSVSEKKKVEKEIQSAIIPEIISWLSKK